MKKIGFTLVELLAVIAILALLVILALPNIVDMFNNAKKSSFSNELKTIYRTASSNWVSDSMYEQKTIVYTKVASGDCGQNKSLQLNSRDKLIYRVTVNSSGKVTELLVSDGEFQYAKYGDIKLSDISADDVVRVADVEEDNNVASDINNTVLSFTCYNGVPSSNIDEDILNPVCSFSVSEDTVTMNYSDDKKVSDYGITEEDSENYNSLSTMPTEVKKYYGWVKDTSGNTGKCSVDIISTLASGYTKKSKKCDENVTYTKITKKCNREKHVTVTAEECRFYFNGGNPKFFYNTSTTWDALESNCKVNDRIQCSGSTGTAGYWHTISCSNAHWVYGFVDSTSNSNTCTVESAKSCTQESHLNTTYVSACTANKSYEFIDVEENVPSCSVSSSFTCNESNKNKSYVVSCDESEYSCIDSSYIKLNNLLCYKNN